MQDLRSDVYPRNLSSSSGGRRIKGGINLASHLPVLDPMVGYP